MSPQITSVSQGNPSELSMDFVEIQEKDPEEINSDFQDRLDEEIKNIIANMKAESSDEISSTTGELSEKMKQDIEAMVKDYEQKYFDDANSNSDVKDYENKYDEKDSTKSNDDNSWFKNENSYSGKVSVSYDVGNRTGMHLPKPTYRCKSSGIVKVNIEVGTDGYVSKASIDQSGTNTSNECLISESLKYAKQSKFNSSINAPNKESGVIIYTFSRQ